MSVAIADEIADDKREQQADIARRSNLIDLTASAIEARFGEPATRTANGWIYKTIIAPGELRIFFVNGRVARIEPADFPVLSLIKP